MKEEQLAREAQIGILNELKDCTFSPTITSPRHGRRFSTFLKEQRDHSARRQQDVEDMVVESLKQEKKKLKVKPTISEVVFPE